MNMHWHASRWSGAAPPPPPTTTVLTRAFSENSAKNVVIFRVVKAFSPKEKRLRAPENNVAYVYTL